APPASGPKTRRVRTERRQGEPRRFAGGGGAFSPLKGAWNTAQDVCTQGDAPENVTTTLKGSDKPLLRNVAPFQGASWDSDIRRGPPARAELEAPRCFRPAIRGIAAGGGREAGRHSLHKPSHESR